jgi:hypothetical protein
MGTNKLQFGQISALSIIIIIMIYIYIYIFYFPMVSFESIVALYLFGTAR